MSTHSHWSYVTDVNEYQYSMNIVKYKIWVCQEKQHSHNKLVPVKMEAWWWIYAIQLLVVFREGELNKGWLL